MYITQKRYENKNIKPFLEKIIYLTVLSLIIITAVINRDITATSFLSIKNSTEINLNHKSTENYKIEEKIILPKDNRESTLKQINSRKFNKVIKQQIEISSGYGIRYHPVLKRFIKHKGVDIRVNMGTSIYPIMKGVIVFAGYNSGYGNLIVVEHGDGIRSYYAHLSKILVKKNEPVECEMVLGKSGNSGMSTGPHLHFEVRKDGRESNPYKYLEINE